MRNTGNCLMAIILIIMVLLSPLQALEVKSVVIRGKTVEIDLSPVTGIKDKSLSGERIKLLGARIVNIYHSYGYTAAFLDKTVLRKDGVLEIYLNEGMIRGIRVQGVDGETAEEIRAFLEPEIGRAFNTGNIRRRIRSMRSLMDLNRKTVRPVHSDDGGVTLLVVAGKRSGSFYGRVGADMIYGVLPEIGYLYTGKDYIMDLRAIAGIKEGELRRLEGLVAYLGRGDSGGPGLLLGLNGGKRRERWESLDLEYYRMRGAVQAGGSLFFGILNIRSYLGFDYERFKDYPTSEELMNPSLSFEFIFSNRSRVVDRREADYTRLKTSAGWENINNRHYFSGSLEGRYPFLIFSSVSLVPRFLIFSLSSDERCLWSYVFDNNMIGIFDDYTASKWKNVAGLDIEYELSRSFISAGPFINSACFINEEDKWDTRTGAGIKVLLLYGSLRLNIIYGWDIDKGPGKGGVYFLIEGGF